MRLENRRIENRENYQLNWNRNSNVVLRVKVFQFGIRTKNFKVIEKTTMEITNSI